MHIVTALQLQEKHHLKVPQGLQGYSGIVDLQESECHRTVAQLTHSQVTKI